MVSRPASWFLRSISPTLGLEETIHLEKTDIINFKSSEIIPFQFDSFPEFIEQMKKYVKDSPTRMFSQEKAQILFQKGSRKSDRPLLKKYCDLEGRGMLRPPRSFENLPNKLVDIARATIWGVFSNVPEPRGGKIVVPNNYHLKQLLEKTDFCIYSNQHLESQCHFFLCPFLKGNQSTKKEKKNSDEYLDCDTFEGDDDDYSEYEDGDLEDEDENNYSDYGDFVPDDED